MSSSLPAWSDRRVLGFGYASEAVSQPLLRRFTALISAALDVDIDADAALAEDPRRHVDLGAVPPPRFALSLPASVAVSSSASDRLQASYSMSLEHLLAPHTGREALRRVVDYVVMPTSEDGVAEALRRCSAQGVAVVPRGGGTSVVGGVCALPDVPCVCMDLRRMVDVLDVDATNMTVTVQAGISGPALAAWLHRHDLTLRFTPQSFPCSTVGGWVATRAAGHFATGPTHIDHSVVSMRLVTPTGTMVTPDVPATGAGPAPASIVLGSEGAFGVITAVTLRVRRKLASRVAATVSFPDGFLAGADAVRKVVQDAVVPPSNLRLVSPMEAMSMGLGDGASAVLLLGYESHRPDDPVIAAEAAAALKLCASLGGVVEGAADTPTTPTPQLATALDPTSRSASFKSSFISAPAVRDVLVLTGDVILETFETAVPWVRAAALYRRVMTDLADTVKRVTGRPGLIFVRTTHVYTDGPALYFTVVAAPTHADGADRPTKLLHSIKCWRAIKDDASRLLLACGATATHHHAVGRDHAAATKHEFGSVYVRLMRAAKAELDPQNIMNPGVGFTSKL